MDRRPRSSRAPRCRGGRRVRRRAGIRWRPRLEVTHLAGLAFDVTKGCHEPLAKRGRVPQPSNRIVHTHLLSHQRSPSRHRSRTPGTDSRLLVHPLNPCGNADQSGPRCDGSTVTDSYLCYKSQDLRPSGHPPTVGVMVTYPLRRTTLSVLCVGGWVVWWGGTGAPGAWGDLASG